MSLGQRAGHGMRVWAALWRIRALHELQYRANLLINALQVLIDLAIGVIAIRLVFSNVDSLNGWSEAELLVVLGTYTILDALVRALILPNTWALVEDVKEGSFDGVLVLPVDSQLVVSVRELAVWDLTGVLIGGGVVAYGAARMDGVTVGHVVLYLLLLPVAAAIVYGFFLAVTSLAFRLIDIGELLFRLFQGASYSGRWPIGIYPGWLRVALSAIVPIGLAVTIPSAAFAGRLSLTALAASVALAVAVVAASRWVFRRQIRAYSGASA